ncbi:DEAD/DEAH box helicase [Actinomadura rudentiformis]|uniref:DEAD/DEAH box helicase n=1 Tax=Actinomadura rudentiformis TaxID=359158 RepID=UPI00178C5400|nr:DEAD/DEAH box helicase [Actinomadura rudentiformis]
MVEEDLWRHQPVAVEANCRELAAGGRATNVSACGSGKSRIAALTARRLVMAGSVLVMVPTLELAAQMIRDFVSVGGAGRLVAVCSDGEVLHGDSGVPAGTVTTRPQQLAAAVAAAGGGRVTVVCTYQSLPVVAAAHRDHGLGRWGLVVVDEAHRTAGAAGRAWSLVHHDAQIPALRRLYMTATPRIYTDGGQTAVSMDDESIYGPTVFELSTGEAIERGLLAEWEIVLALVSPARLDPELLATGEHVTVGRTAIALDVLALQVAVLRAAAEHDVRKMITFHHRVASARAWAIALPQVSELLAEGDRPAAVTAHHIHGGQKRPVRQRILDNLRAADNGNGELLVVANSRVLAEGVDAPAVDAIGMIDSRASEIDIVQIVGRALRTGGRKGKVAKIIVPILMDGVDPGAGPQSVLEGSAFSPLWRVLRALRAHDQRLVPRLRAVGAAVDAADGSGALQMPDWLSVSGRVPFPDDLARAVLLGTIRSTTQQWTTDTATPRDPASGPWREEYAHAAEYYSRYGDLDADFDVVCQHGFPVGRWIRDQRRDWRGGYLTPYQTALLDTLGMIWHVPNHRWRKAHAVAAEYRACHGTLLDVPPYYIRNKIRLRQWLDRQIERYHKGTLPPDHAADLEALGVVGPNSDRSCDRAWARGHAAAQAYHRQHRSLYSTASPRTIDGVDLDTWLPQQQRDRRAGKLTLRQIQALDTLGMRWDGFGRDWRDGLADLTEHHQAHGHIHLSLDHQGRRIKDLGRWLQRRREDHAAGTLTKAQAAALHRLGIWWDPILGPYAAELTALEAFHTTHGDLRLPPDYTVGDLKLDRWLCQLASDNRHGIRQPPELLAYLSRLDPHWHWRSPQRAED